MAKDSSNAATGYDRDALIARARALAPVLRGRAEATSEAGRIPDETFADLWDADLFYLMKPKAFGGPEVRPDVVYEVAAELGRGDGSAAWVWVIMSVHDLFYCYFPVETQEEFWNQKALCASSFMVGGQLAPEEGGFRLSGKWSFCSGIDGADWMLLACIAGMISEDPPIPDIRFVIVPKSEGTVIEDWKVIGLRGTGSKSYALENVFIPANRMVTLHDLSEGTTPGAKVHDSLLYKAPVWSIFPFTISSSAHGIARGALDSYIDDMKGRATKYGHEALSRKPTIQIRVSEASALIDAAELLYRRSLKETIDKIFAGETLSVEHRVRSRRDQAYSIKMVRQAADLLFAAGGGGGIYDTAHVQRAFRDLQALQSHIVGNWDMPALNFGSVALGNPPTDPFF